MACHTPLAFLFAFLMSGCYASHDVDLNAAQEVAATEESPPITFEEFEATAQRDPRGGYIVDGDIPIRDLQSLREYYDSWNPPTALTVNQVFGGDDLWDFPDKYRLTYCVRPRSGIS
jgi:hypothetical protein